jgi:hypothetical protein
MTSMHMVVMHDIAIKLCILLFFMIMSSSKHFKPFENNIDYIALI